MRKASTRLPEQGTQTPSPAPDLIPAEPKKQPRTHIRIGTANGGTSPGRELHPLKSSAFSRRTVSPTIHGLLGFISEMTYHVLQWRLHCGPITNKPQT
jgi:hypothetical protein